MRMISSSWSRHVVRSAAVVAPIAAVIAVARYVLSDVDFDAEVGPFDGLRSVRAEVESEGSVGGGFGAMGEGVDRFGEFVAFDRVPEGPLLPDVEGVEPGLASVET